MDIDSIDEDDLIHYILDQRRPHLHYRIPEIAKAVPDALKRRDSKGRTPMMRAACDDDSSAIEALLAAGDDPSGTKGPHAEYGEHGEEMNPLEMAAWWGNKRAAAAILKSGKMTHGEMDDAIYTSQAGTGGKDGIVDMIAACMGDEPPPAHVFLEGAGSDDDGDGAGQALNEADGDGGRLHELMEDGFCGREFAGVAARRPEEMRSRDSRGLTPMIRAAHDNLPDFARALLEAGDDPNEAMAALPGNPDRVMGALSMAALMGHGEVVEALLSSGRMSHVEMREALCAAQEGDHIDLACMIADRGDGLTEDAVDGFQDPEALPEMGPVMESLEDADDSPDSRAEEIAQRLSDLGHEEPEPDSLEFMKMDQAIEHNDIDEVSRLIKAGFDVAGLAGHDGTALHRAIHFCRPDIARLLIRAGADLEAESRGGDDYPGFTPLDDMVMGAVECDDYDDYEACFRLLVEEGASVDGRPQDRSHIEVALYNGNDGAVELLIDLGANLSPKVTKHGGNLVHEAVAVCRLDFVQTFIGHLGVAAANETTDQGHTCLDLAMGHMEKWRAREGEETIAEHPDKSQTMHYKAIAEYLEGIGGSVSGLDVAVE